MKKNIESIYPLSPMQEGMLFHSLYSPNSGTYVEQLSCRLTGGINVPAFKEAWQKVTDRHPVLRTGFVTEKLKKPLQIVHRRVSINWQELDWRHETEARREVLLADFLETDLRQGFAVAKPPLMRFTLCRLTEDAYQFIWSHHHALMDGWCFSLILRDAFTFYQSLCTNTPVRLPPAGRYEDYIRWIEKQDMNAAERYWRRTLRGFTVPVPLGPTPVVQRDVRRVANLQRALSSKATQQLRELARANKLTVNTLVQGAWALLLSRYSGRSDVLFGVTVSGRPPELEGVEETIGLFINTLPLRILVPPQALLLPWLKEIQEKQIAIQELAFCPLVEIQEWSEVPRGTPLFECMTAFENYPVKMEEMPFAQNRGEQAEAVQISQLKVEEKGNYPIVLVASLGAHLKFCLHYDAGRYAREMIEQVLEGLEQLLEKAISQPEARLADLQSLSLSRRREIVEAWRNTAQDNGFQGRNAFQLVSAQGKARPDAIALTSEQGHLTYGELNLRANQLAHYLRSLGVGPEVCVGACLNPCPELLIAQLAILKAGGVYIPIDPKYPLERIAFIVEDASISILLTQAELQDHLPSHAGICVSLDEGWDAIAGFARSEPVSNVDLDNLAYAIYTSGSTGKPKGVNVPHRGLLNLISWHCSDYKVTPEDRATQLSGTGFDALLWDIWPHLAAGVSIHMPEAETRHTPEKLVDWIVSRRISLCFVTTALGTMLLDAKWPEAVPLRALLTGGERLTRKAPLHLPFPFINHYGPTECSVVTTRGRVPTEDSGSGLPSIGSVIPNARTYVLDRDFEPVAPYIGGEIFVAGEGLSRGYIGRPDLTAESFIPDTFAFKPGERMYRSGDLAYCLPDGSLMFLGRADQQVKIRGYRLELGEIENTVNQHEGVLQSTVVVQEYPDGQRALVAYLVPKDIAELAGEGGCLFRLPNGQEIVHFTPRETDLVYREIFEDKIYFPPDFDLEDDACVFDIGANIGMFTLFVHHHCANPRVYAFEPSPDTYRKLVTNVALYNLGAKAFNIGISDRSKTATLNFYPEMTVMSGVYSDSREDEKLVRSALENQAPDLMAYADQLLEGKFHSQSVQCEFKSLSDVIRDHEIDQIDLLKIDVEKSEWDVLRGVRAEDWPKIRQIAIEVHNIDDHVKKIEALLQKNGYEVEVKEERWLTHTGLFNIYAKRKGESPVRPARGHSPRHPLTIKLKPSGLVRRLKAYLQEKLPEYMVPSKYVLLDRLPLTPNGKIDRRALPDPDSVRLEKRVSSQLPRGPIEEVLAGIWKQLLRVDQVFREDDFFDHGGHSLLATQLISRIRQVIGVEFPLKELFENPQFGAMAEMVEASRLKGQAITVPAVMPVARGGDIPLSFAQERLWFLDQLEPNSPLYNMPAGIRIQGDLNSPALERSFSELFRRHESLRTTFVEREGRPVQVIREHREYRLPFVDLSALPADTQSREVRWLAAQDAWRPFNLSRDSLLRFALLHLGPQDHVLLYTMHHIVSDGWSMGILIREFTLLYEAFSKNQSVALPPLPVQYADFAAWQRSWLQGAVLERQINYWKEHLKDAPALVDIPLDRPRPPIQSVSGETMNLSFSKELSASLKELAKREGVTLYMVLSAGFNIMLHRISGQTDIVIGSTIANRNRSEIENIIGFFVNTLVFRTRLDGNLTVRELLRQVRENTIDAYAHQDLPFERLVQEIQPERHLSHNPLFQILFELQNTPGEALRVPGLAFQSLGVKNIIAKFDMTVSLVEGPAEISGYIEYNKELYSEVLVSRMMRCFEIVLKGLTDHLDRRLKDLPVMEESERRQLIEDRNPAENTRVSGGGTFIQMFERMARHCPDAIAASSEEGRVTYARLNQMANRLARHLRQHGVGPDSLVGLLAERSAGFMAAVLGIFKADGAYIPLDSSYPVDRLALFLRQSGCRLIVMEASQAVLWERIRANHDLRDTVRALVLEEALSSGDSGDLPHLATTENLAYVIYTSGSTGLPKGVMITHEGMLNHLHAKVLDLKLNAGDVLIQNASPCFDISVWQLLAASLVSGRVHLVSRSVSQDPELLCKEVEQEKASILEVVPSMLRAMCEEIRSRLSRRRPNLRSLRCLMSTGEALPKDLVQDWFELFPGSTVINAYGPTECSDDVTHHCLTSVSQVPNAHVPIGRPLTNLRIYLLDSALQPVPVGSRGELCVGGVGVGRGYLGAPQATANVFVPDPYSPVSGARMFRTGDMARYGQGDAIEFLGRFDYQVKIRGFRIELSEIEAALNKWPAIRESIVVKRSSAANPHDVRLVAYVVDQPNEHLRNGDATGSSSVESERQNAYHWGTIFDEVYRMDDYSEADPAINRRVWINSYTGRPYSDDNILECVEDSVRRILESRPKRILEIGCGTGLLLERLAPECEYYCGTDISASALDRLRRCVRPERFGEGKIELIRADADDFDALPQVEFDAVLLNEIVQYMPSIGYAMTVIKGILPRVRPGGFIFVGGVRNRRLLDVFHGSVQLAQANGNVPHSKIKRMISVATENEKELTVDPEFFSMLQRNHPEISCVELNLKGGQLQNEFTKYRYDVTLWVNKEIDWCSPSERLDWRAGAFEMAEIHDILSRKKPKAIEIVNIPNGRIAADIHAFEHLQSGSAAELNPTEGALAVDSSDIATMIEPETFWRLARENSYHAEVRWSQERLAEFDVWLTRVDGGPASCSRLARSASSSIEGKIDWDRFANSPARTAARAKLISDLKRHLKDHLPEYMVPADFVVLDRLPLTENGKVDQKSLPEPAEETPDRPMAYAAPRDSTEVKLSELWSETLGRNRVGIDENFFEIGGHSLLATQLMSRARNEFNVDLPLRVLFQAPTVAELGAAIHRFKENDAAAGEWSPLVPLRRNGARAPLFVVHPVGGGVSCYLPFVSRFDPERPVFGLQAPELYEANDSAPDHGSLEEMAGYYVNAVRSVSPQGPYNLAGWSYGGVVAFEMAQQLLRKGEKVAFLGIIDAVIFEQGAPHEAIDDVTILLEFGRDAAAQKGAQFDFSREALGQLGPEVRLEKVLSQLKRHGIVPENVSLQIVQRALGALRRRQLFAQNYRPQIYPGTITLFKSQQVNADMSERHPTFGWQRYATEPVREYEIPGLHTTLVLEPNVRVLAEKIFESLSEVRP